ncbi:MAG: membrane dipeptidase [Deltaproteobacteria bacterium]
MMRRILIAAAVLLVFVAVVGRLVVPGRLERATNQVEPHAPWPVDDATRAFHQTLLVGDLHADTLLWDRDLLERANRGHVDLVRLAEGNAAVQVFATVTKTPSGQNYESNTAETDNITALALIQGWPLATWTSLKARALHQAARLHDAAARAPDRLVVLEDRGDLEEVLARRARGESVLGGLLATEGSHALDGELASIAELRGAGFRMMSLQHFFDNSLGGSLHGQSKSGLTPFGREVVLELVRQKIMLDVAHSSPAVVEEVLAMVEVPLVVSHTGIHSICPSPRNISDRLMRKIGERGGLIGIGFWDAAVCDITPAGIARAIRGAVSVAGIDHVALGSDWDGGTTVMVDASELPALTQALLAEGFTRPEVGQIMGGNLVRYLRENLPVPE